jgi:protein gp37
LAEEADILAQREEVFVYVGREEVMIDTSKGRYWDLPWSLVDGCTPCSPGCDHCWAAAITHRFGDAELTYRDPDHCWAAAITHRFGDAELTYRDPGNQESPRFTGKIITHPERFSIPLKRRKPTVYAVWNDLFHEVVPDEFVDAAYKTMISHPDHTFLVLTIIGNGPSAIIGLPIISTMASPSATSRRRTRRSRFFSKCRGKSF